MICYYPQLLPSGFKQFLNSFNQQFQLLCNSGGEFAL